MNGGREDLLQRLRELERANRMLSREVQDLRTLVDTPLNVMLFSLDLNYNYIAFNQAHREFVKTTGTWTSIPACTCSTS